MKKLIYGLGHRSSPSSSSQKWAQPPSYAESLATHTFKTFYSPKHSQFEAPTKSESTLGANDHFGYVVWPVIIFVHATADTLGPSSAQELRTSVAALQHYWNPTRHGFCAWKMFEGNDDVYYDDNAHAAQALISAYQVSLEKRYLGQAKEILRQLIIPAAAKDGGVPWHVNFPAGPAGRNACSTGPAAIAALRICLMEKDDAMFAFAKRALQWMITKLRDADGLICDGLDGKGDRVQMKWSYNTGFAIHGFVLLYELTKRTEDLDTAISLAEAALNREGALFDNSAPVPQDRFYSDGSFFLHHLVDGYRVLSRHALTQQLKEEIRRMAAWGREWMLDPCDGLYFRGSAPWKIDEERTKRFNERYGVEKSLEKNMQERDESGHLCKTLIGNAGWARIFAAEIEMGVC